MKPWFTFEMSDRLDAGEIVRALNGKTYAICFTCRKLVRMDKPLIRSLHVCKPTKPQPTP